MKPKDRKQPPITAERLRGLAAAQAQTLRRAAQLILQGERPLSGQLLLALSHEAPDHAEVLRWRGIWHFAQSDWTAAAALLARAQTLRPGDFADWMRLGTAQNRAGDFAAARQSLDAAQHGAATAQDWLALSLEFDHQGHVEAALAAVEQALEQAPDHALARLQRARCAKAMGLAESAASDCRALIARGEHLAQAWFSLVDLKTVPLDGPELAQLEQAAGAASGSAADSVMLAFALGNALEQAGRLEPALAALHNANRLARQRQPWDAAAFSRHVAAVRMGFETAPCAAAREQGREVIFLVGLPRSGTTLVEQVLASHSQVEAASELPYLGIVIERESRRRGQAFPGWVGSASADDWTRLGQDYLAQSARWRTERRVATDKLPENWLLAGAALAMLPGASVIDCRRDPLETCWSCYKQLFGPEMAGFSYGFDSLVAYWQACDELCRFWAQRYPDRFLAQHYEALVAEPEVQIRALLQRCELPFEPGCLDFHQAQRAVRTPSALQVRQPLQRVSAPAARYGALLDPLRLSLDDAAAAGPHPAFGGLT